MTNLVWNQYCIPILFLLSLPCASSPEKGLGGVLVNLKKVMPESCLPVTAAKSDFDAGRNCLEGLSSAQ